TAPAAAAPPQAAQKPVEAAAAKPAAQAKPEEKIGRNLIGKVEGPTVITDPAQWPKSFKEAPMLAELVQQGKLPPVDQRIPQDPLVLKPTHEIGKYGGTWRRGFTGPADYLNGIRAGGGPDFLLYVDPTGNEIVPNIAKGYEVSQDGRTTTLQLRRGMKWSDGQPFTADDFVFWFEDLYQNKELNPNPVSVMAVNGKQGVLEKVDEYTVRFRFEDPYYLLPDMLSISTAISGQATQGLYSWGGYAPKHYLSKYHPKYTPKEQVDKQATDAGFDNWVTYFNKFLNDWSRNPDLPVVSPWKTVTPATTPTWTFERNPYSIWVDTEGNQLPYIDRIQLTLAENLEIINLRAIAGEYDYQARHIDIGKLPVFLENQEKGNYKVSINPMQTGSDYGIFFNMHYDADPELNKWFNNLDFRRALSLGMDRDQINETFFLGVGTPGSAAPAESNKYSPGPEWRTRWSTYDPEQANALLDKAGLTQKDAEGYRQRSDGKGRLSVEITTLGGQFVQFTRISEMVREHWKKLGIDLIVQERERSLVQRRAAGNETQLLAWSNDGTDTLFATSGWIFPADGNSWWSPEYGKWYQSDGAAGREPPEPMRKCMELTKQAFGQQEAERIETGKEIWRIALDAVWYIGGVGQAGAVMGIMIAKNDLGNTPSAYANINLTWPPSIARPVQFYWKK
ncbi:MAG: ABC transporter substrate-binding protein, partial [Chloroflexota bacterium]|nr:ABC transporter substrate-binding protein [Chloroflexota bacterium]